MTLRTLLTAGAAFLALGDAANATTLLGLTADGQLVKIDSETRRAAAPMRITGADGRLLGIDQRPSDGKLYGVTDAGQIVTIDPATARATQVSRLNMPFVSGGRAVVDFNPVADRLRLMGMSGQSFRINVASGEVTRDGELKYQAGSPWAETRPRVVAGAYTNSMTGATATQLFTIDTLSRSLNLQAPPNDGVQQPKGQVAASLPTGVAFDILAGTPQGFLLAGNQLHMVNLETGAAGAGMLVTGLPTSEVIDIAAWR